jgi:hypothetical protein
MGKEGNVPFCPGLKFIGGVTNHKYTLKDHVK